MTLTPADTIPPDGGDTSPPTWHLAAGPAALVGAWLTASGLAQVIPGAYEPASAAHHVTLATAQLAAVAALWWWAHTRLQVNLATLFKAVTARSAIGAIGYGLGLATILHLLAPTPPEAPATNLTAAIAFVLASCIAAPLLEETTFRGMVHRGLAARLPSGVALFIGAAAFSLAHAPATPAAAMGYATAHLVLAHLATRDANLTVPAIAHATVNAAALATALTS